MDRLFSKIPQRSLTDNANTYGTKVIGIYIESMK